MAIAYAALLSTISSHLATCLGVKLLAADDDTIDALAQSNRRIDCEWFYRVDGIVPSIEDLNSNRLSVNLSLAGIWSTTCDPVETGRILRLVASGCRTIQITPFPAGVDLIEITGDVALEQQYGLTIASIPLRVMVEVSEV